MGKRIHIVGCAPRSGTTLMAELMANGFEIDGYSRNEMSIFKRPVQQFDVFCSKNPQDVLYIRPLLTIDRDLWVIYMLRDPRDVIVSRHRQDPDRYWANLRQWRQYTRASRAMADHPRFLTVRYEDLVRDPVTAQEGIMRTLPFLVKRASFAEYHRVARPSDQSSDALRGVRPISVDSIGGWRQHKPRVAAQLELHGPITKALIELGYEKDAAWLRELDGIEPAGHSSHFTEEFPRSHDLGRAWRQCKRVIRYAFRATPCVSVETLTNG